MFCCGKYYLSRSVNLTDRLKILVYRNIHYLYIGYIYSYEIMVLLLYNGFYLYVSLSILIAESFVCVFDCVSVC